MTEWSRAIQAVAAPAVGDGRLYVATAGAIHALDPADGQDRWSTALEGAVTAGDAKAQADAEAIKIQAQAINSQGGADYVALQAIGKWNGVLPVQMIPGGAVPFINLAK